MSNYVPQAFGIAPNQIPAGVAPPPGYETPEAVKNLMNQPGANMLPPGSPGTPASPPPTPMTTGNQQPPPQQQMMPPQQQMMQLPDPRNNPKCYVYMQGSYYRVLSLDISNRIEFARAQGQPICDIGHGKQVNVRFFPHPSIPGVAQNETKDIQEYVPQWFYMDNSQRWSPMSPSMCMQLSSAKARGETEARDAERTYDLIGFNQVNRESQRRRPLLYLRDDGSAVRGESMGMWAYQGTFRGAPASVTVPFHVAEQLDQALMKGYPQATVQFTPAGSPGPANVQVKINPGLDQHEGEVVGDPYRRYNMMRFFPTWFFLDNDMHWAPLDFASTIQLDAAAAYGFFTSNDHEREYDLIRLLQINLQSKKVRPLIQVRGHAGVSAPMMGGGAGSPTGRQPQQMSHPEVFDRANIVTKKMFAGDIASQISNMQNAPVRRVLYFLNALVHEFKFVIKGGILRDAVVKNDISNTTDVEIELPEEFARDGLLGWVDQFLSRLESAYQIKRDSENPPKTKDTTDIFSAGGRRAHCNAGIVNIGVILPGDIKLNLECITPWNTAMAPPRNVDISVNNLRITFDSTELSMNVPMPYGGDDKQRFNVNQIIKQILSNEATPSYDYQWVPGSGEKTGEGYTGQMWVVGYNVLNPSRAEMMDAAFNKMRAKGYKFVEGPR